MKIRNYTYDTLKRFIDWVDKEVEDIHPWIKEDKYAIQKKGYGTPEMEMKFMHLIFLYIQSKFPDFKSFSWEQGNDYNDEFYHFSLESLIVNELHYISSHIDFEWGLYDDDVMKTDISLGPIDYPENEMVEYAKERNLTLHGHGLDGDDSKNYYEYREKKYKHLELPSLKFIAFLKMLEINFSMYYFIYVFGNGVEVKFTKEGVRVKNINLSEYTGLKIGDGMRLEDLEDMDKLTY